ncbi:GNAT family N-acetyltransferase [Rhizobium binxianense]
MQQVLMRTERLPPREKPAVLEEAEIACEHIVLRRPEERDIAALVALADDLGVAAMLSHMPHPYRVEDAARFVRDARIGKCVYAIVGMPDGVFLGCCGFRMERRTAGIECWLGRPYWNRGYGTEALQRLVDLIFSTYGEVDRIEARPRAGNAASCRLVQKCGFQFQAPQLAASLALSCNVPVEWYALDRKTWTALKRWCLYSLERP